MRNFWHNKLVTPIVNPKFDNPKFQNLGFNTNGNAQLKKLSWIGFNFSVNGNYNDFYEPRQHGRFFKKQRKYRIKRLV